MFLLLVIVLCDACLFGFVGSCVWLLYFMIILWVVVCFEDDWFIYCISLALFTCLLGSVLACCCVVADFGFG